MIAGCPTCAARYRIDTAKLRPEGARLRCSRCETVFRVRPPAEAAPAPESARAETAPAVRPVAAPESATASERSVPAPEPTASERSAAASENPAPAAAQPDPANLVLVAHPEQQDGKAVADALAAWGLSALLVHDGVEAILNIQRTLPRIVVLDAALPKMFGFQVCELMKRNEQLRGIPVVLVGAIHDRDRYRREPEELYGADAYLERHELPDGLLAHLSRFGLAPTVGDEAQEPPPTAEPPPVFESPPTAEPPPTVEPASAPHPAELEAAAPEAPPTSDVDPELEKAMRFARIIVSDVILYNQEKFEAAVDAGNVVEALRGELEEGYALFAQRIDANAFDPQEFLQRELVRAAKSRGMA